MNGSQCNVPKVRYTMDTIVFVDVDCVCECPHNDANKTRKKKDYCCFNLDSIPFCSEYIICSYYCCTSQSIQYPPCYCASVR